MPMAGPCYHPNPRILQWPGVGIAPMQWAEEGAKVMPETNPCDRERFFGLDPSQFNLTIGDGDIFSTRRKTNTM